MTDFFVKLFVKDAANTSSPAVRMQYGKMASYMGVICNVFLFSSKLAIGILSGSISITADAVNNLSDAAANITTLVGFRIAEKPADAEHPFGHARSEYVSGLIVALLILLIGFELLKSSVHKILNPTPVEFSVALVAVLGLSIIVKLWMGAFNRKIGKKINSTTLIATGQDSINDVYSTSAVLIGAIIGHFSGWMIDGWMGLAVAVFILYSGYGLAKETLSPLIGEAPNRELVQLVTSEVLKEPMILGIHDLMVHDYGPGRCFASLHAEISTQENLMEAHDAIDAIERKMLNGHQVHLVIHYDPILVGDPFIDEMREKVVKQVAEVDSSLSIHDLRVVRGPRYINIIFDVVKPFDLELSDTDLRNTITQKLKKENESFYPVITIDNDFTGLHS